MVDAAKAEQLNVNTLRQGLWQADRRNQGDKYSTYQTSQAPKVALKRLYGTNPALAGQQADQNLDQSKHSRVGDARAAEAARPAKRARKAVLRALAPKSTAT